LLKTEAEIASTPSIRRKMPAMTVNVLSVSWGETTKNTPTPSVTTPNSTNTHHSVVMGRRSSETVIGHSPIPSRAAE
jgi:hypothetical protein